MSHEPLRKTKYAEYIRDFTALGNPFLLLLVAACVIAYLPLEQRGWTWAGIVGAFLLNELVCSGIKFLWHKPRPNGQQFDSAMEKIDAGSFPSIHAARIALVYGSLSIIAWQTDHPFFLPIAAVVIPLVGYTRIFLQKHFLTDVLAGYAFGSAWCFILYRFWF